jgi:hypothetical protein
MTNEVIVIKSFQPWEGCWGTTLNREWPMLLEHDPEKSSLWRILDNCKIIATSAIHLFRSLRLYETIVTICGHECSDGLLLEGGRSPKIALVSFEPPLKDLRWSDWDLDATRTLLQWRMARVLESMWRRDLFGRNLFGLPRSFHPNFLLHRINPWSHSLICWKFEAASWLAVVDSSSSSLAATQATWMANAARHEQCSPAGWSKIRAGWPRRDWKGWQKQRKGGD